MAAVTQSVKSLFSFPNPVNEVAARIVAAGVVLMSLVAIVADQPWIILVIAYGFIARVLTGPTLSPLGRLATQVLVPRLPFKRKLVPGPPKRFAQGIGVVFSVGAAVLAFGFDNEGAAYAVLGALAIAATLESVFALCLGCKLFSLLMRIGVIPASVCEACENFGVPARAR